VKRRSPLDTLKDLRQRAHDSERARLAAFMQAEKAAEEAAARARRELMAADIDTDCTRREEDRRLSESGISAAEGQRRMVWETASRQTREQLADELERATRSHREASAKEEQARGAVQRADAELKQVQEHLDQASQSQRRLMESAEQEALDESSSRRFVERNRA
jgi:hypothetical protein